MPQALLACLSMGKNVEMLIGPLRHLCVEAGTKRQCGPAKLHNMHAREDARERQLTRARRTQE
eukprot:5159223-Alexandrium_andersonii.AAC.1